MYRQNREQEPAGALLWGSEKHQEEDYMQESGGDVVQESLYNVDHYRHENNLTIIIIGMRLHYQKACMKSLLD